MSAMSAKYITVQVRIKSAIIFFHPKNNSELITELYCNLKQLFSCFLASTTLQDEIFVSKLSSVSQRFEDYKLSHLKQSTITDFFSSSCLPKPRLSEAINLLSPIVFFSGKSIQSTNPAVVISDLVSCSISQRR